MSRTSKNKGKSQNILGHEFFPLFGFYVINFYNFYKVKASVKGKLWRCCQILEDLLENHPFHMIHDYEIVNKVTNISNVTLYTLKY